MPGLTIRTDPAATAHGATNPHNQSSAPPTRTSSSPTRPPVSPITPTFEPRQLPGGASGNNPGSTSSATNNIPGFALGRPLFTHTQPDQAGIAPPPAEPIAFDDNPDVLALKSAISILQLQRVRAAADMQTLRRAKDAALADPTAFVADLTTGRVGVEGDQLIFPVADGMDVDSSSDEDDVDDVEKSEGDDDLTAGVKSEEPSGSEASTLRPTPGLSQKRRRGKQKDAPSPSSSAWGKLPKPQSVVRCPPVNWAQYGVVGESLDKLHAEQVTAPTLGAPAVLGAGGSYEFKAGDGQPLSEAARRLPGIAAPYIPGKDRIDKKAKGARR